MPRWDERSHAHSGNIHPPLGWIIALALPCQHAPHRRTPVALPQLTHAPHGVELVLREHAERVDDKYAVDAANTVELRKNIHVPMIQALLAILALAAEQRRHVRLAHARFVGPHEAASNLLRDLDRRRRQRQHGRVQAQHNRFDLRRPPYYPPRRIHHYRVRRNRIPHLAQQWRRAYALLDQIRGRKRQRLYPRLLTLVLPARRGARQRPQLLALPRCFGSARFKLPRRRALPQTRLHPRF